MEDVSLGSLGRAILLGFLVLILSNILLFLILYADTFTTLSLPYSEDFETDQRITWRQHGGTWVIRDSAMIQTNDAGTDLMNVIPLQLQSDQTYRFSADLRFVRGRTGGGLMFNMQHPDTRQESHMVRFGTGEDGQGYLVYGTFDENFIFKTQGTHQVDISNQETLGVQIRGDVYDVLVGDQIISKDNDIIYVGGYPALTSWFSMVAYDNISLIALDDSNIISDMLPITEPNTENLSEITPAYFYDDFTTDLIGQRWIPISGQWQVAENTLQQQQRDGFDLTIRSADIFTDYAFTARFSHTDQSGAGIMFNMPDTDNLFGTHMARFFPNDGFVWGYFDEQTGFTGQGFLLMQSSVGQVETITVTANGETYNLSLNEINIVKDVPLVSTSGYVGLTTSETGAMFDVAEVRSTAVESVIIQRESNQGDWSTNGSIVTQNLDTLSDYYRSVGVYGEVFITQVIVELPDRRSNAQGGLLFHAPETQNIRGAHWVRLANDGIQLIWGVVDNDLQYVQSGVADLDSAIADSRLLTLQVRVDSYDILVDNKVIEQGIPLQRSGGWLGFSALGGPTQFSNFKLSLTQS